MASPEHVYTEAEILYLFGTDYDLPKDEEDEEVAPYRFLRQWYLVKKDNPNKPVSLPQKDRRLKDHILRGQLEPTSGASFLISVEIPLSDQQCWVVDRTHEGRGIWIGPTEGQRESAWYRLRDPHTEKQASLHQNIRAKLGLLSNIIDALEEQGPDGSDVYYTESHFKLNPKQLHERLSCSNDAEFQLHQSERTEYLRFQEPFDYELFQEQRGLAFCKEHMAGSWVGFDDSRLGKAIKTMKSKSVMRWTPEQFEESARLAEERSQRQPWGEPLPHARNIHPNWHANANQEQSQHGKKKNRNKETNESSANEDFEEPMVKKRAKRRVAEDSKDDERERLKHSRKKARSEEMNDSSQDEQATNKRARHHASEVPPAAAAPAPFVAPIASVAPAPATAPAATTATGPVVPTRCSAQTETAKVAQNAKKERDEMLAALDKVEKSLKFAGERTQKLLDSLGESNPANVAASPSPAKANVAPPSPAKTNIVPPSPGRAPKE